MSFVPAYTTYSLRASGERVASQGLVTTVRPLKVSMPKETRRLPVPLLRSITESCGKIDPAPWFTCTIERMCGRYALGRVGCTSTDRLRLSVECPFHESTTPPVLMSTACKTPEKN